MSKYFIANLCTMVCLGFIFSSPVNAKNPVISPKTQTKDSVVRSFTAFGGHADDYNSGWRAVIKNNQMALELIENNEYHRKIFVARSAYAKGVEFTGKTHHGKVVINIRSTPCQDNQGNMNEFRAILYYKNKTIKGCAVRGTYTQAPT